MTINAGSPVVAVEQSKNVALSEAIDSIDRVYCKANTLLARIEGGPISEVCPEDKVAAPCLRDILSDGPDLIREKRNLIEDVLDRIEAALF